MSERTELGVAMVSHTFMAAARSQGGRNGRRLFDLTVRPEANVLRGRTASAARDAAAKPGWKDRTTDWREVLDRDADDAAWAKV